MLRLPGTLGPNYDLLRGPLTNVVVIPRTLLDGEDPSSVSRSGRKREFGYVKGNEEKGGEERKRRNPSPTRLLSLVLDRETDGDTTDFYH